MVQIRMPNAEMPIMTDVKLSDEVCNNDKAYFSRAHNRCSELRRKISRLWGILMPILTLSFQLGCDREISSHPKEVAGSSPPPKTEVVPLTNMVSIKAGTFVRIKHPVTLTRDFWLGKYEVTQGEYSAVMGKNPSHFPGDPNRPVEKMSWFDAVRYCSAITKHERDGGRLPSGYEYRLPSEAEWDTPVVQEPRTCSALAMRRRRRISMRGPPKTARPLRIRSARNAPIRGGFTIYTETFGNGVWIGLKSIQPRP